MQKLESMCNEVFALLHSELDTILSHLFIICLDRLQRVFNLFRHYGFAELDTPIEI